MHAHTVKYCCHLELPLLLIFFYYLFFFFSLYFFSFSLRAILYIQIRNIIFSSSCFSFFRLFCSIFRCCDAVLHYVCTHTHTHTHTNNNNNNITIYWNKTHNTTTTTDLFTSTTSAYTPHTRTHTLTRLRPGFFSWKSKIVLLMCLVAFVKN